MAMAPGAREEELQATGPAVVTATAAAPSARPSHPAATTDAPESSMKTGSLLSAASLAAAAAPSGLDQNAPPPNLTTLAEGSLFGLWRPRAHVLPPRGKVNDPCMHYVSPATGRLHVGFLHGDGVAGATTDDLVTYADLHADGAPFIAKGGALDPVAVFDGSVVPAGLDGRPTLLYTAVSHLPIHWTLPYQRGSEAQALAVVHDDTGRRFDKLPGPAPIPGPPAGVNATGFRDPFVFQHAALDAARGAPDGTWYAVVSGGEHGVGGALFLYQQAAPGVFTNWTYEGPFFREAANATWGQGTWAGRWGFNFEAANVVGLSEAGYDARAGEVFVTFGTEWSEAPVPPERTTRHDQLWAAGSVSVDAATGRPAFRPSMAGTLDWGAGAYAAAGKEVPAGARASRASGAPDRFVTYVWLTGDDYDQAHAAEAQQGWKGALLLPRELSRGRIAGVVDNALAREEGAAWRVDEPSPPRANGTVDLVTLRQTIAREPLAALRARAAAAWEEPARVLGGDGAVPFARSPASKFFTLRATLRFPPSARAAAGRPLRAGFQILASDDREATTVTYDLGREALVVDRSRTSAAAATTDGILTTPETGRLRLFDVVRDGARQVEALELLLVVDNAVLEVHANDRFALSTWVRSWYANSTEIRFFQEGDGDVQFGPVEVHEGLFDAWPERKA